MMVLGLTSSFYGQGRVDERGVYIPTAEEIEATKRMRDALRHPTFIALRLVSVPHDVHEEPSDQPSPYNFGDSIYFQLMISHTFFEPIVIWQPLNSYYDIRPELLRDGELVPYRKKAQENVEITENQPPSGSGAPRRFLPGREYDFVRINSQEWYAPLKRGHYQFNVRRRFVYDGEWIQSNSVSFEVQ